MRAVRRAPLLVLLLSTVPAGASKKPPAAPLPVPPMAALEKGTLRSVDLKSGRERWRANWISERIEAEGVPLVRSVQEGVGVHGRNSTPLTFRIESTWETRAAWLPRSSVTEYRRADGTLVERIETRFAYPDGPGSPGRFTLRKQGGGRQKDFQKTIPIPAGTVGPEALGAPFRGLPLAPGFHFRFHLANDGPRVVRLHLVVVGEETITAPAGTFRCYKLRLIPEIGFLGIFARLFIPDTYFWQSVQEPHLWIRYEGLETGLGSPKVRLELVSFEPAEFLK